MITRSWISWKEQNQWVIKQQFLRQEHWTFKCLKVCNNTMLWWTSQRRAIQTNRDNLLSEKRMAAVNTLTSMQWIFKPLLQLCNKIITSKTLNYKCKNHYKLKNSKVYNNWCSLSKWFSHNSCSRFRYWMNSSWESNHIQYLKSTDQCQFRFRLIN